VTHEEDGIRTHLAEAAEAALRGDDMAVSDPIVQVVWKDEGDFGFIDTFRQSDLDYRKKNPDRIGVPYDPDYVRAYGSLADLVLG
jgi:hypothetical protein